MQNLNSVASSIPEILKGVQNFKVRLKIDVEA